MSNTNEQLAAAIVRANERLDWIEARDGKLPDDNYATIETTVGLVRALRGATAADTVTVDRASLTAHNLEKWEQIDSLQREVEALKAERDGIQQAYAEQSIVWVQDQDTIERLTLQLAASEQRAAALVVLDEVYEWQRETFPSRTPASIAAHLLEEAGELAREPLSTEEMADVAMLLFALVRDTGADLAAALAEKLARNRLRDWSAPPNAQGYVKARAALAAAAPSAASTCHCGRPVVAPRDLCAAWERFNTSTVALIESASGEYVEQRRVTAFEAGWRAGGMGSVDATLRDTLVQEASKRIKQLTAERDEWKRINDSDNRSAARRVEEAESALAASEQRAAALARVARASQGIIHEGLHGGKPTDPDHQDSCELPACRHIRAALDVAAPSAGAEGA